MEERTVYLIFSGSRVALRQRPGKGLLASLWELPNTLKGEDIAHWGLNVAGAQPVGRGKHIFTHIEWHMEGISLTLSDEHLPEGWVWADRQALRERYPVPNAFAPFLPLVEEKLNCPMD